MLGRGGVDAPLTCGQWRLLRPTQQLGGSEPSPRPGALTPVLSPQPPWQPPTPETHTHTPHGSTWAYRELEGEKNWVHKARDPGPSQAMSAPRTPQTLSSAVQGPRACAGSCEASSCKPAGAELRMSVPDNPERRPPCRPPDPLEDRPSPRMPHGDTWGCLPLSRIPSRVHGSLEPFCPSQAPHGGGQDPAGPPASIPKLKLTRPGPPGTGLPPPKIRLKPRPRGAGEREPVYRAELVEALNGHGRGPRAGSPALLGHGSAGRGPVDSSSGSSGEDEDFKPCAQAPRGREGLAFLAACPGRGPGCAGESVWSSDSPDESRSSSSEVTFPDTCDLSSGDGASVRPSSKDARQTVPPLTVRLHTQSVSKCVTGDGRTVAVGDIVWGKIHGFPWWPARVLDLSLSQKEDGEPSWQEAKVSWFGSPTTSFLSTSKLSPFSEFFKLRFNRKKKGMYRKAITEAANAAQHVAPEIRELLTQFET
uniref:PWWP domain-containing protein n=1 Tax=Neovison vison TaxID=452646 RepID=A0A8C7APG8_NEOVI